MVQLTRYDKAQRAHVTVSIPLVTSEKSTDSGEDDEADDEGLSGYRRGGYHPVNLGETYSSGRYRVVHKLGWGQFSTVWLCLDAAAAQRTHVAVKFIKSAAHYMDAARDEVAIMESLKSADTSAQYVCELLDSFALTGPNGRHLALVFPVLGMNLWDLIEQFAPEGLSLPVVQHIAAQLLAGVAYMHAHNVIHTDLKPENVALREPSRVVRAIMEGRPLDDAAADSAWVRNELLTAPDVRVVDFGNACWTHKHFTDDIQTTQYGRWWICFVFFTLNAGTAPQRC